MTIWNQDFLKVRFQIVWSSNSKALVMALGIVPTIKKPDHSKSGCFCLDFKWFLTKWCTLSRFQRVGLPISLKSLISFLCKDLRGSKYWIPETSEVWFLRSTYSTVASEYSSGFRMAFEYIRLLKKCCFKDHSKIGSTIGPLRFSGI